MSVAKALKRGSALGGRVRPGKQALRKADREQVDLHLLDSLDLDEATRAASPGTPRWDYLAGMPAAGTPVIAIEVHPANTGEARLMVAKKQAALALLKAHLAPGHAVRRWFWIASGTTKITRGSPEARLLDKNGIRLVGHILKPGDID